MKDLLEVSGVLLGFVFIVSLILLITLGPTALIVFGAIKLFGH